VALTEYQPGEEWDPYCLRVTGRCLREDLNESANPPTSAEAVDHELAQAFVEKRSRHPKGQETIQPLAHMNEVYSLHAQRWRGATWHDEDENVVWLVAGAIHRSGAEDDLYPHARDLDANVALAPSIQDYDWMFEARDRGFFDVAYEQAEELRRRAQVDSPREVSVVLGGRIPVSLVVEDVDGMRMVTLAISWQWVNGDLVPPPDWLETILALFFPWVTSLFEGLSPESTIGGRPAQPGEQIWAAFIE